MSLGHWIEMRAIRQARGSLGALAELLPDTAERIAGDDVTTVPIGELAVGDLVLVRPGARIPADGEVVTGSADVDESMVSGESRPVLKEPGAAVVAGTVVAGASLRITVTAVGEATALSGIMRLVAEAQAASSRAQALADRAAAILFYVALVAGAVTLVAIRKGRWSAARPSWSSPVRTRWDSRSRSSSRSARRWVPATAFW
jgi:Cu2+-exporting ATPase